MKVKEESEKVGLKLNIQKTKIMASGPVTSREIDGETVETVADLSLQMVIAVVKLKDATLWRESYDQPRQHIKKQRHYFVFKGLSILAMAIKKAEHQRIDAFELWCWRRLLKVPWTARRSNQSILRRSVLGVHWKD